MKLFLLSLILLGLAPVYGQIPAPVSRDAPESNIEFLSGHWEDDSFKTRIEFKEVNREMVLLADSFYTYHFVKVGTFPLQGVTITWPPHDCSIKKNNKDQIEITFTNFGGEPVVFRYRKILAPGI
jgi:hypothetical protein